MMIRKRSRWNASRHRDGLEKLGPGGIKLWQESCALET